MKLTISKQAIIALLAASVPLSAPAADTSCTSANSCAAASLNDLYIVSIEIYLALFAAIVTFDDLHLKADRSYIALDSGSVSYRHAFGSDGASPFPNAQTFRIAGGYRFYDPDDPYGLNLSFEASYTALGNSTIDYGVAGQDIRHGSSVQIAAIFSKPVTDRLEIAGKLGYSSTKTSTLSQVAGKQNTDGSNTHFTFGAGIQYHLDNHYLVRIQYENLGAIDRYQNPAKASIVSAGLAYEF